MHWKLPEPLKTHPTLGNFLNLLLTLITLALLRAPKSIQLKILLFCGHLVVAFKGLPKTWEAYFIKWTTSGEPPVGSKSHQDSKWGHSKAIHYYTNWLPPCNSQQIQKDVFSDFRLTNILTFRAACLQISEQDLWCPITCLCLSVMVRTFLQGQIDSLWPF